MKKLKEIPFNHELIGQEGIVVKFRSGETCESFVSKNGINSNSLYPVIAFDSSGTMTEHTIKGRFDVDDNRSGNDLIMYEEIEVKEPRVIWVNIYEHGSMYAYNREINAKNSFNSVGRKGKTVKFIEVIEEGE